MAKKATARTSKSSAAATAHKSRSSTTTSAAVEPPSATASTAVPPTARPSRSSGTTRSNAANEALRVVLNRLAKQPLRCVDVETSGLDWRTQHIVGYVLSFSPKPQDSYYVPFRHLGNDNVDGRNGPRTSTSWDGTLAPGEDLLLDALDQQGTTMFGHNLSFDLKFLFRTGRFKFKPRCEDTMINAVLINEWQGRFSLEFCADVNKVQAKKSEAIVAYLCSKFPEAAKDPKRAMGHFWRLAGDDPMAVEYAAGDGTTTWQLRDKQMVDIRRQEYETIRGEQWPIPTMEQVWDVESRLIPVLARMSTHGIKIDEERLSWLRKEIKQRLEALQKAFPPNFNARSNEDVQYWMEQHGHTDWPQTAATKRFPAGNPSFTKGWLENYDAGNQIISVRKLETLRDTFVLPMQTTHLFKGRVHTNYNQLRNDEYGTITGRLSSDSPNLQAVPKHDEEIGRLFRSIFVPDDGQIWGSPDMNQCEPRLLAFYSDCKVLKEGYLSNPPVDAHTSASAAANANWPNMSEAERKHYRNEYGKRINQTIITGGGKGVLVSKYKVDPKMVDKVWNDYFKAMPEIRNIQKKMQKRMEQRGYLLTLLNRRCRLRDPSKSYVALNRALQGGNADIIKYKLVEIDEYLESEGRPIQLLNNCHDAIDFQFSEDNRKHYWKCLEIMQDVAGPPFNLDIPIPVDGGEGRSWAEATYGAEK